MSGANKQHETSAVDLGALLDAGDGAVVTLTAGKTRLVAHKAVLSARSPVFDAMFRHDMLEASSGHVTVRDVEGPVLLQLVRYMYTLRAPQLPSMVPQLLVAADKYCMSGLKAECEQQLAAQLCVENAAATAALALRHLCPSLTEAAVAFIQAHFVHVVGTQGWADMKHCQPDAVVQFTRRVEETKSLSAEERGSRLIQAADDEAVQELLALLAAGADVTARDRRGQGWTALHYAALSGTLEAVRSLLQAGAEADASDSSHNTPLQLAAYYGHTAVVRLLVAASADPNARDSHGWTPLYWAVRFDHAEVEAVLLEAGATSGVPQAAL